MELTVWKGGFVFLPIAFLKLLFFSYSFKKLHIREATSDIRNNQISLEPKIYKQITLLEIKNEELTI